jgi:hypothetical protein
MIEQIADYIFRNFLIQISNKTYGLLISLLVMELRKWISNWWNAKKRTKLGVRRNRKLKS